MSSLSRVMQSRVAKLRGHDFSPLEAEGLSLAAADISALMPPPNTEPQSVATITLLYIGGHGAASSTTLGRRAFNSFDTLQDVVNWALGALRRHTGSAGALSLRDYEVIDVTAFPSRRLDGPRMRLDKAGLCPSATLAVQRVSMPAGGNTEARAPAVRRRRRRRPVSTAADPGAMCRICHDGAESGRLFSPCHCSGSMRYVHVDCLAQWRRVGADTNRTAAFKCGACNYSYGIRRTWLAFAVQHEQASTALAVVTLYSAALVTGAATLTLGRALKVDIAGFVYSSVLYWYPPWHLPEHMRAYHRARHGRRSLSLPAQLLLQFCSYYIVAVSADALVVGALVLGGASGLGRLASALRAPADVASGRRALAASLVAVALAVWRGPAFLGRTVAFAGAVVSAADAYRVAHVAARVLARRVGETVLSVSPSAQHDR